MSDTVAEKRKGTFHLTAIDCETGGTDPKTDALLSVALVRLDNNLNPIAERWVAILPLEGKLIHPDAVAVNHYSPERWKELGAVPLAIALSSLGQWLGAPDLFHMPLAHNATFDRRFLKQAEEDSGVSISLDYHWHCSCSAFAFWRQVTGNYGKANLDALCALTGYPRNPDYHDVLDDARACAFGYKWLVDDLRRLRGKLMDFSQAAVYVMPFGQYKGKTIDQIATTDGGLRYLDWLSSKDDLYGDIGLALRAYLADPTIQRELKQALK